MTTSLKIILVPGLLFVVAVGTSLRGAESQVSSSPGEVNSEGRTARIVAVDTPKRTLTLRSRDTNYLFLLSPHLVDTRTRQPMALDELAVGQSIHFISRPQADGRLEIVSLIILHHEGSGAPGGGSHGGPLVVSPFQ